MKSFKLQAASTTPGSLCVLLILEIVIRALEIDIEVRVHEKGIEKFIIQKLFNLTTNISEFQMSLAAMYGFQFKMKNEFRSRFLDLVIVWTIQFDFLK